MALRLRVPSIAALIAPSNQVSRALMIERPDVLLARCFSESCQRGRKKWTNTATNAELPNKKKHHPDRMLSNVSGQNETRRVLGASVLVARRRPRVLGPL